MTAEAVPIQPKPTKGQLSAAIARAVVRVLSEYWGRGPTKAQAFFRSNVVVVVMEDTLTRAEQSLVASGREDAVLELRRAFEVTARGALQAAVERLTGCLVTAVISGQHVEPDCAAEIFVLDRPVPS